MFCCRYCVCFSFYYKLNGTHLLPSSAIHTMKPTMRSLKIKIIYFHIRQVWNEKVVDTAIFCGLSVVSCDSMKVPNPLHRSTLEIKHYTHYLAKLRIIYSNKLDASCPPICHFQNTFEVLLFYE